MRLFKKPKIEDIVNVKEFKEDLIKEKKLKDEFDETKTYEVVAILPLNLFEFSYLHNSLTKAKKLLYSKTPKYHDTILQKLEKLKEGEVLKNE